MLHTVKRYLRLYRVLVVQFFKVIMQSKVDFFYGIDRLLFHTGDRNCIFIFGLSANTDFTGMDFGTVDFHLWICADSERD